MEIICKKNIEIHKYEAILKLEVLNERLDVAKFLEEKLYSDEDIAVKIKKTFMREHNLIDDSLKNLTKKGEEVLNSKYLWEVQEGEFEVYSLEDNFISRIIGIEKINAFSIKNNTEKFNNDIIPSEFDSKKDNRKYKIKKDISFVKKDKNYKEKIMLEWILNDEKEELILKYPDSFQIDENTEKKGIVSEKFIESYMKEHGIRFNKELKKLEYGEDFKKFTENEKICFNCNKFDTKNILQFNLEKKDIEFDEIKISHIGIMPDSKKYAEEWALCNLKSILNKSYITSEKYMDIVEGIYDKQSEIKYWEIKKPTQQDFLNNNFYELKNSNCYWNVAAPFDLLDKNIIAKDIIQFIKGADISLKSFVDKITSDIEKEKIKDVILIDAYVFTDKKDGELLSKKIKIVESLKKLINPKNKFIIYTQERDLNKEKLKIRDEFILEDNKVLDDKHPRYFILIMDNQEVKAFTIDRSIDFIDYTDIHFQEDTIGKSKSFTVSTVEIELIEKSIQSIIKERLK